MIHTPSPTFRNAVSRPLPATPGLERLNVQFDQFLVGLTRRVLAPRPRAQAAVPSRPQLTPCQRRRLRNRLLRELRGKCRVRR